MFHKIKYVLQGFVLYVFMSAVDFASSIKPWPEGFYEANHFARHQDLSFYPLHALINIGVNTIGVGFLSASLYVVSRAVDRGWAQFMATLPWIYFGWVHLDAALSNLQIRMGLFVPDPPSAMERLVEILARILGAR